MAKVSNKLKDLQFWYPNIPRKLVMAKGISIQAKYVYMYMSCQSATFEFFLEPMAKEMNIGVRTLTKYLSELIESGWVTKGAQKYKNGRLSAVDYTIETSPKKKNTDVQKTAVSNSDVSNTAVSNCADKDNSNINIPINNNSTINSPVNKENKECVPEGTTHAPSDEEKKYIEGMRKQFPRIMKMDKPLTLEQAKKLKEKYDYDLLRKVMSDMENWKPLLKKSISAYHTIVKWCNMEINRV